MDIILWLSLLAVACVLVLVERFIVITELRMRALHVIYKRDDWLALAADFGDSPDANEMFMDWTKWTFSQFYPHLVEGV